MPGRHQACICLSGIGQIFEITAVDCWFREYIFLNVSYFLHRDSFKLDASFFKIMCFCRLQVLKTQKLSVAKQAKKDCWKSFQEVWTESSEWLNAMGKHYVWYVLKVLELCCCVFLLRQKMLGLMHKLFLLLKTLLAHSGQNAVLAL